MSKIPRIGVVGSSNVDLVTYVERMPVWGETISAPRFEMSHGGKGANQAVAAAKLGASVVMVSKVGDDMLGEGVLKNFEAIGVGTKHVQRVPGQSTGTATILVNATGDNFILIVKGANGDLTPADVEAAGADLRACDLILLQLEVPLETVYAALAFGKKHGVKTALNPAPAVRDLDMDQVRSRELPHAERDGTRHSDRHAGRVGGRDRRGGEKPGRPRARDGHRHARRARVVACHGEGAEADRAGEGSGGRLDRRRRRLHRLLRALLRRGARGRGGARSGDPIRRQFRHEARRPEVVCDRGGVRGAARQDGREELSRGCYVVRNAAG